MVGDEVRVQVPAGATERGAVDLLGCAGIIVAGVIEAEVGGDAGREGCLGRIIVWGDVCTLLLVRIQGVL